MIRSFVLLLILSTLSAAQSISVTSPTSGQSLTGTSIPLSIFYSNLPSLYSVQYVINGETGVNYNQRDMVVCPSCSSAAYNLNWNSFYVDNGPQFIYAVARDALNNVLATSPAVAFTVANTLPDAPSYLTASYSCSWGTGGACPQGTTPTLTGTQTITVSYSGTNASNSKSYFLLVDGNQMAGGAIDTTATTATFTWNTASCFWNSFYSTGNCYNGVHNVAIVTQDLGNGLNWSSALQYEFQANFSNGSSAAEIVDTPGQAIFMTPGGATQTVGCSIRNVNLSSSSCTSPTYTSSDTTCATVNSSGVVTPNSSKECVARILISANGLTNATSENGNPGNLTVYVFNDAGMGVPNLWSDGSMHLGWTSGKSGFWGGLFNSQNFTTDPNYSGDQYASAAVASGLQVVTPEAIDRLPNSGETQSAFQAHVAGYIATYTTLLANHPGLLYHVRFDPLEESTDLLYQIVSGYGSAWSPTAMQSIFETWPANGGVLGGYVDEINFRSGNNPLMSGNTTIGGSLVSNIVSNGSGSCTINFANSYWPLGASSYFQLHGTGVTNLDSSSTTPNMYHVSSTASTSLSFSCPGVASGTYSSGGTYEPFAYGWTIQTSSFVNNIINGANDYWTSGSSPSGPYLDYVHYNVFQSWITQAHAASSRMNLSWPPTAVDLLQTAANWMGTGSPSDYTMLYTTAAGQAYLPHNSAGVGWQGEVGTYRSNFNYLQHGVPLYTLMAGLNTGYSLTGYPVALSSCANGVCTTSADHQVRNIIDGDTRATISGTGTAMDGNWYIARAPTSTTLLLYGPANFTASAVSASGTITFDDGNSYTLASIAAAATNTYGLAITISSDTNCLAWTKERGQTATISGSSYSAFSSYTYYLPLNSGLWSNSSPPCPGSGDPPLFLYPLPQVSWSGSATIAIQPNNKYVRGRNKPDNNTIGSTGQELGPNIYLGVLGSVIAQRASAFEGYGLGGDPDSFSTTNGWFSYPQAGGQQPYGPTCNLPTCTFNGDAVIPYGAHPYYDVGGSRMQWEAWAAGVRLENYLSKWMYQPSFPSPDYGTLFDCAAHGDGGTSVGNVLHCVYYGNGPWTRTFNLSPYLLSGQPIIKLYGHWYDVRVSTLTAGTTSDTVNGDANTWVAYVFSANEAADLIQPSVSYRLADISGASQIAMRCAYSPWLLANAPAQLFSLGTGSATLSVDEGINKSYCKTLYLNSANQVLATSDVATY